MTFRKFPRIIKLGFVLVPLLIVGGYAVHEATAEQAGIRGQSTIGCGGIGCHGTQSSSTVVKLYADSSIFIAGQTYTFHFTVTNAEDEASNPGKAAAGCDISADHGAKLAIGKGGEDLWVDGGELTHFAPFTFPKSTDSASWAFKYTAPKTVGVAHIYAAGNAVNGDGLNDAADHWDTTSFDVNIMSASVTQSPVSRSNVSLYPNPSKGSLTLSDADLSGPADVTVSDAAGRNVLRETLIVGDETPLDFSSLPNGNYFLTVRPHDGPAITKSFVIAK